MLWNHGAGWKEDDIYAFARERQISVAAEKDEVRGRLTRSDGEDRGRRRLGSSLFLSSAARVTAIPDPETRGICYDDSSMDFLDNAELNKRTE